MLCTKCLKVCGLKKAARENPHNGTIGLYPTDRSDCCGATVKASRIPPPRFMGAERR